jgi:diguanylate cyclase (GGDEF)-like protein/PAS domain S-box-containing protein
MAKDSATLDTSSSQEPSALPNLELLAAQCMDAIAWVGADMRFIYISPSCKKLFLRSVEDTIGHHIAEFVFPDDLPIIAAATRSVINGEGNAITATIRVIRGDGSLIWIELNSRLMGDAANGAPGDRAVTMRDVSDRKALEDELRAMAMKDGLTGLANRRAFDEALVAEWHRTVQEKSQMSLLLIDIDFFKKFNDAYGHQTGDDCLRSIGAALCSGSDIDCVDVLVARYGGEELAIILPISDSFVAATIAERVRAVVERLAIPHGPSVGGIVTVSVGVATALACDGGSAEMPSALLASADKALYMAKTAGRNCWRSSLLLAAVR